MEPLSPKVDVVFKLLFSDPRNEHLLVSLLSAVLRPTSPIVIARVLSPELARDHVEERGLVLDLLIELADGRRVDVEMQCDMRRAQTERWLFHWARVYTEGIGRGDAHEKLRPVVCIVFLDSRYGHRFHSTYRMLEVADHTQLSSKIEIHTVSLLRSTEAGARDLLALWARFLRVSQEAELLSLAAENPIMTQAKDALDRLSSDPNARAMYEARLYAEVTRRLEQQAARDEGIAEGKAEGITEGKAEGIAEASHALRLAIDTLCDVLAIEVDERKKSELAAADFDTLTALLTKIRSDRAWR